MTVLEEIQQAIKTENIVDAMRAASRSTLRESGNRIFDEGLDSTGNKIGEYSTKPIYISKKDSPRNAGEDKGKSLFFPGGYKQFKGAIGRGEKVNLKLFGRLQTDYVTSQETTTGTTITYSLKDPDNVAKKDYAEDHFKTKIWDLTKTEEKNLEKRFYFELRKRIS